MRLECCLRLSLLKKCQISRGSFSVYYYHHFRKMSSNKAACSGKSEHCKVEEVARAKWICLNKITYKDPNGVERIWEGVSRTTKSAGEADAVGMVTIFHDPITDLQSIILIRQYRPPMETYTIEFPAGLIDKNETADVAAVREMKEETGYDVSVVDMSPGTSLDPGVGSTTLKIATCKVDTSNLSKEERPKPTGGDSDEFVQVLVEPMKNIMEKLKEFAARGDCVDSRVYAWASALCLTPQQS